MKKILLTPILVIAILSCSNEETKVDVIKVIENIDTTKTIKKPNFEIITDLAVIKKLKDDLIKERQERERIYLNSLPLSERLIAGDSTITDTVITLLEDGSYLERSDFLKEILIKKTKEFKITNNEIEKAFITQINDTVIERQAIKTIGALNLNYSSAFQIKFNDSKNNHTEKYFYWLGRKGQSIDVLSSMSEQIKNGKIPSNKQSDIILGLEQFSHSRIKEIRAKAIDALLLAFKNQMVTTKDINTLKQKKNRSNKAKSFVKSILRYGDDRSSAVVSACLSNNIFIKATFLNLIRNKNNKLKAMLLQQIGSKKSIVQALPAVPSVYKFLKDSTIAIELLKTVEKQGDYSPEKLELIYGTFKNMGAMNWYRKADKLVSKKELIDGLKNFKDHPVVVVDYNEIALSIFNFGLTDSLSPNIIEEIKTNGMYSDENGLLKNILSYSGKLLTIEKLAPETPINYTDLFESFRKRFSVNLNDIIFVSEYDYEKDKYSWLIIGEEIAIIAHPKNEDDVYDVKLFLSVMNQIKSSEIILQEISSDEDVIDIFSGSLNDSKNVTSLLVSEIN